VAWRFIPDAEKKVDSDMPKNCFRTGFPIATAHKNVSRNGRVGRLGRNKAACCGIKGWSGARRALSRIGPT
jgi:hypothetical protein